MKSSVLSLLSLAVFSLAALCGCKGGASSATDAAATDTAGVEAFVMPLSVSGRALVNAAGDTVVLTGPSLGWHTNWGRFYNASTVKALKEKWGANITRAAIGAHPSGDCVRGYSADSAYAVNSAIAVIDAAIDNDMYVICDWHSHSNTAADAKQFFQTISSRYGDDPHIIYEIWNEPIDVEWGEIKDYAADVVPVIRANAPSSVVIVGTPHWDQDIDLAAADPIDMPNLLYAVHFYAGTHKEYLRDKTEAAIATGLPVIISECGSMEASGDGPIDYESWQAWIDLADRHNLSVLIWDIADKEETCSMLNPDAPSEGEAWADGNYKEWARLAMKTIKDRNAR